MNAPAPATAGPTRAAPPPQAGHAREAPAVPVGRGKGEADFEAVLSGRGIRRPGPKPQVDEPTGLTPGQELTAAALVPAVPVEANGEPAVAAVEPGLEGKAALLQGAKPGVAAAAAEPKETAADIPPLKAAPAGAAADQPAAQSSGPRPGVLARERGAEGPVHAEAKPGARELARSPAAGAHVEAPAPAPQGQAPDASGPALVIQPGDAPSWRLAIDQPPPGRSEAHGAAVRPQAVQPQAVQPQAVVGQIAVAVSKAAGHKVEIRLDPPELGRVQIHLTPVDGGLQATVLADRPETQDLLRRHAEMLVRDLGAAGYDTVSLDFAAGGEAEPGRRDDRGVDWTQAQVVTPAVEPLPAGSRPVSHDGLDIRL